MIITCKRCPHFCKLGVGEIGRCGALSNKTGNKIESLICKNKAYWNFEDVKNRFLGQYYGRDEFKLFVYGGCGCNLSCPSCPYRFFTHPDDHEVYELKDSLVPVTSSALIEMAEYNSYKGCRGILFGVSEPLLNYEYIIETSKVLKNNYHFDEQIFVLTNGCFSTYILEELIDWVDGIIIFVRCWDYEKYKNIDGDLDTVKEFIKKAVENIHTEITFEIIQGFNDDIDSLEEFAKWLSEIEELTPIHINRHVQANLDDYETTSIETMKEIYKVFSKYFKYIYVGSVSNKDRREIVLSN